MGDVVGTGRRGAGAAVNFRGGWGTVTAVGRCFTRWNGSICNLYIDLGLAPIKIGKRPAFPSRSSVWKLRSTSATASHTHVLPRGATLKSCRRKPCRGIMGVLQKVSDTWLSRNILVKSGFLSVISRRSISGVFPRGARTAEAEVAGLCESLARVPAGKSFRRSDAVHHGGPQRRMIFSSPRSLLWGKSQGYSGSTSAWRRFPVENRSSPRSEQVRGLIFRTGKHFYNFGGIRAYKAKFHPVWDPIYLAVP